MLTTGSKTLEIFTKYLLRDEIRLICRMLPNIGNMEKCNQLGIKQKDIIAIQGPFSESLNKSLYEQYQVTLMITKESGKVGSVDEKMTAALAIRDSCYFNQTTNSFNMKIFVLLSRKSLNY